MLIKNAVVDIEQDEQGKWFFHSEKVDLDKESLFVPVYMEGALATAEWNRHKVTFHPANGESLEMDPEELMDYMEWCKNNP